MKISIKRFRLTSLVLTILIVFQSCRVYKKNPITIDEAVKSERRIKIKTLDNNKFKFKRVIIEESNYYGIKRVNGDLEKVPIMLNTIDNIRVHNKTMSIVYGSVIAIVISFVTIAAIAIGSLDFGLGGLTSPN